MPRRPLLAILGGGTLLFAVGGVITWMFYRPSAAPIRPESSVRHLWRMPPLETLAPSRMGVSQRVWMAVLRVYLVVAVLMVVVRIVQLAFAGQVAG